MANALIKPTTKTAIWIIPSVDLTGATAPGEATGINNALTVISGEGEDGFLAAAQGQASVATYKPLPATGAALKTGEIYGYNGGLVIVRQDHTRTQFAPETTPALFCVYRAGGGGVLDWVTGEKVDVGTHRKYNGVEYVCKQAHVTQTDWTPLTAVTLWQVYTAPSANWQVGVAYKIGDLVLYNSVQYRCIQAHTSIATWTPSSVPALWTKV